MQHQGTRNTQQIGTARRSFGKRTSWMQLVWGHSGKSITCPPAEKRHRRLDWLQRLPILVNSLKPESWTRNWYSVFTLFLSPSSQPSIPNPPPFLSPYFFPAQFQILSGRCFRIRDAVIAHQINICCDYFVSEWLMRILEISSIPEVTRTAQCQLNNSFFSNGKPVTRWSPKDQYWFQHCLISS